MTIETPGCPLIREELRADLPYCQLVHSFAYSLSSILAIAPFLPLFSSFILLRTFRPALTMLTTFLTTTALFLPLTSAAGGLYTKASPVLQLDAKSYNQLIAKSNYTSIVEFYAPWCGHCQNLKPAYEKAATALDGIARVAAVNCDEEENKAFCGSMDVKGFPTLKIVKPMKSKDGKKSRPMVEDYQGGRTAKAIHEAVSDKVPNHVTRLKDAGVTAWLQSEPTKPKAIFFSEKGTVSPLIKAVAIDFLGSVNVAFVRSTEKGTVQKYSVTTFPTVVLLPGKEEEPVPYSGDMKKQALIDFLSQVAQAKLKQETKSQQFSKSIQGIKR
jgi:protein disulfide-isomerase A6